MKKLMRKQKYARFTMEPLERGFGITLGNSIKTHLALLFAWCCGQQELSLMESLHEFSTIDGVLRRRYKHYI